MVPRVSQDWSLEGAKTPVSNWVVGSTGLQEVRARRCLLGDSAGRYEGPR